MIRYFPPNGTAGLARSRVRGYSRVPFPPASTMPNTRRCELPGTADSGSGIRVLAKRSSQNSSAKCYQSSFWMLPARTEFARKLNFQENLSTVHPKQDDPEGQHYSQTIGHWQATRRDQRGDRLAEMDLQSFSEEALHRPTHHVDGNGIHAHHDERECPAPPTLPFNQRVEACQHEHDQASAVQRVRRRPHPFHDWT